MPPEVPPALAWELLASHAARAAGGGADAPAPRASQPELRAPLVGPISAEARLVAAGAEPPRQAPPLPGAAPGRPAGEAAAGAAGAPPRLGRLERRENADTGRGQGVRPGPLRAGRGPGDRRPRARQRGARVGRAGGRLRLPPRAGLRRGAARPRPAQRGRLGAAVGLRARPVRRADRVQRQRGARRAGRPAAAPLGLAHAGAEALAWPALPLPGVAAGRGPAPLRAGPLVPGLRAAGAAASAGRAPRGGLLNAGAGGGICRSEAGGGPRAAHLAAGVPPPLRAAGGERLRGAAAQLRPGGRGVRAVRLLPLGQAGRPGEPGPTAGGHLLADLGLPRGPGGAAGPVRGLRRGSRAGAARGGAVPGARRQLRRSRALQRVVRSPVAAAGSLRSARLPGTGPSNELELLALLADGGSSVSPCRLGPFLRATETMLAETMLADLRAWAARVCLCKCTGDPNTPKTCQSHVSFTFKSKPKPVKVMF